MTDIVKRLRECIRPAGYAMTIANVETIEAAAAEIERLGALAAIVREQGFEIERLRAELRAVLLHVAEVRAENERMETK